MTVYFNGEEYELRTDITPSNRVMPNGRNVTDVADGEEYDFELVAYAAKDGELYEAYWVFTEVKGNEPEGLDYYNYSYFYDCSEAHRMVRVD